MTDSQEQKITIEVAGESREFTPAELQEHVQSSMRADQREADVTARESNLSGMAQKAQMMETWEGMIANDPDQAVKQLYGALGREAPAALGGDEEEMFSDDDDSLSAEAKATMRSMRSELRDLKARDQRRTAERAQDQAGQDLEGVADQFPHYKGENRDTFKQMVAVSASQAPNVPMAEIGKRVHEAFTKMVQGQTQQALDDREGRESQRQNPGGSGSPPMAKPDEPMTQQDMRSGKIKNILADQLRKHTGMK